MKIALISDTHIKEESSEETEILFKFFDWAVKENVEEVILLGDIFDMLVGGHNYYYQKYQKVFDRIYELQKLGINVSYFEGNHDFAFSKIFESARNVTINRTGQYRTIDGMRVYIGHGDELALDKMYQIYTAFLRSKFMRFIINAAPSSLVKFIGEHMSRTSRKYSVRKHRKHYFLKNVEAFITSQKSKLDLIILGHSHFTFDDMVLGTQYINAGRCGENGLAILIEDGKAKLITLQSESSP